MTPLPPKRAGARTTWRAFGKPWLPPVLVSLVLGLWRLGSPELWRDELASWSFATRQAPAILAGARNTGGTQLAYYLILHYWIAAFGDSVDEMRMLSVVAMAGAAACVAILGRQIGGGDRAGLTAGLIFALIPSISRFAQEVRFYSFEVLAATLATILLLRALERPALRRWAAYGVCVAALGYIDIVALSLLTAHVVLLGVRWWRSRDNRLLWFGPAVLAALAACLPMILLGSAQAESQIFWIPRPGLGAGTFTFFASNLFYSTPVAIGLVFLAVAGCVWNLRAALPAAALAILPVASVWLISQGPHSYFFPRYLLFTVAAWAILASIAVSRLNVTIAAVAVLGIGILGISDQLAIRELGAHNWASYPQGTGGYPDYAGAAQLVARDARLTDGAVYEAGEKSWLMVDVGLEYYLQQDVRDPALIPHVLFVAKTAAQADALYSVPCARPAACLGDGPRIWVVDYGPAATPYAFLSPPEAALLRSRYRVTMARTVHGMRIFLLTERGAAVRSRPGATRS